MALQPFLIVVPDVFGSHLADADGRVWLDADALSTGGLDRLALSRPGVASAGVIASLYGPLCAALDRRYEVDAFDYDWRRSIRTSGRQLAAHLETLLSSRTRRVRVLAHGMGGLVAAAMLADHPSLRTRLLESHLRMLMLGVPEAGTWEILRLLAGVDPLVAQLARLDSALDVNRAAALLRTWPGLLQLLPRRDAPRQRSDSTRAAAQAGTANEDRWSWFRSASWREAGLTPPDEAALASALDDRRWLEESYAGMTLAESDGTPVVASVAGVGLITCCGVEPGPQAPAFLFTTDGDGRVLRTGAVWPKAPAFYPEASHPELIAEPELIEAYLSQLERGESALPTTAPASTTVGERARERSQPSDEGDPGADTWGGEAGTTLAGAPATHGDGPGASTTRRPSLDQEALAIATIELAEAAIGASAHGRSFVFPLMVSVVHGHLREARYPVAVGHYVGDGIVNAEAALDRALGGRLRERFDLGVYPGPEGTSEIVAAGRSHPPGAIVIGLGEVGELSPELLRRAYTTALVKYALVVAESDQVPATAAGWRPVGVTSVLIGTDGGSSVSLGDSIHALVGAAVDANRQLRQNGVWDRARVQRLEIVELYEDVAIQAAHVVAGMPAVLAEDEESPEELVAAAWLEVRPGGEFLRPADPHARGWWRRIGVRAQPAGTARTTGAVEATVLQFTTLTDRARLEQDVAVQNRAQIEKLVEQATSEPRANLKLSNTLFELLVPAPVKERIRQGGDLLFQVDGEGARYPFELLAERRKEGPRPLAFDRGLLRQLVTETYRDRPVVASGVEMLVVGEPDTTRYRRLPGARAEARHVQQAAQEHGFRPTLLVGASASAILDELFARDYRILHVAAHGLASPDPLQSGVVIGDDQVLNAAAVAALSAVPELVFLNCCHLGRLTPSDTAPGSRESASIAPFPALAASLAEGFIRIGVHAVVAAGWAVDDVASAVFARCFYRSFLAGDTFGSAVQKARGEVWRQFSETNTWGAYQCYGNPDHRLKVRDAAGARPRTRRLVSRTEALAGLRSLAARARGAHGAAAADLLAEFGQLRDCVLERCVDGETLAELASVAAELEDFEQAIELYRRAVASSKARTPIAAIEQLANMLSRWAPLRLRTVAAAERDAALALFTDAAGWLRWLSVRLPPSRERLALVGALHKRWALVTSGAERRKHLRLSLNGYADARALAGDDSYQALNWIALRFVLEGGRSSRALSEAARAQLALANRALDARTDPDFWTKVGVPDALLHVHLVEGALGNAPALTAVLERYRWVLGSAPTARELASVRDHVDFLAEMLDTPGREAPPAVTALRTIGDLLRSA